MELLGRIQVHIMDSKVNAMIEYLLQSAQSQGSLPEQIISAIHEEVRSQMESKMQSLIQCAYLNDDL